MQFMGATLRKITLKDGLTALLFSLALTGGLAQAAGINPARSPLLLALVAIGAGVAMFLSKLLLGTL